MSYQDTLWVEDFTPLQRCSRCIIQLHGTVVYKLEMSNEQMKEIWEDMVQFLINWANVKDTSTQWLEHNFSKGLSVLASHLAKQYVELMG